MGGSSSQPHIEQPMSPIHAFSIEDMYSPEFSNPFQQNTSSFKEITRETSPVEVMGEPSNSNSKPTRGHQNRMVQNEDAPRQIAWTNAEEILLCKGWVHVSESSKLGNTRKDAGLWTEVLHYMESKTKLYCHQTYDEVNKKWKTVRPNMVWFCGVYGNVMRRAQESRDEDYYNRALFDYEAGNQSAEGTDKRYKTYGSSPFNTESGEASINSNVDVGDDEEEVMRSFGRHLEKIHVTWTQSGKKWDKIATLHEDDQEMAYSSWRRRHNPL
ncbi:hypothetical protein Tco_0926442 [Tanacetum coccineum]|uniref:Myb-like domain-containing protein n=1 Tax=Tanacetum coccineum TaxID=301880 RepID=A0ABQ5DAM2_9ASTR